MSLGKKIAYLRKKKKISQDELADIIGVTRGGISMYERDQREPDIAVIIKFSKFFNVSVDYLVDNTAPEKLELSPIFYESNFGPLKNLTEDDFMVIKTLIDHLNKKNSK